MPGPGSDSRGPTVDGPQGPVRLPRIGPGSTIGNYRIESELGRGAVGVVFAARQLQTNALVALKVTPGGGSKERFEREVQALAKIRHPNVVAIHEMGETPTFRWVSMDLVDGLALDQHLAKTPGNAKVAVKLLLQVTRAMEHAHGKGLVHRDLKPANVLVAPDGTARVSDFGIAKHLDRNTRLTEAGAMVGTLQYMSPEQCADSASLDVRSDVWAIGVMLFEAVTGTLPWSGDSTITIVSQICREPAPRPRAIDPTIDPDLEAVILRALEKEPDQRYPDMAALSGDLERWLRGETVSASRITLVRAVTRRLGLRLLVAALFSIVVLLGTGCLLASYLVRAYADARETALRDRIRASVEAVEQRSERALERARGTLAQSASAAHAIADEALDDRDQVAATLLPPDASAVVSEEAASARKRLAASPVRTALVGVAGRALLLAGDAPGACTLLETETWQDPELVLELGEACLAEGETGPALEAFGRARDLAPERWEPPLRLAEARLHEGRLEGVDDLIEGARKKQAPRAALAAARAQLMVALGRGKEALDLIQAALKSEPQHPGLRLARARALLATGDEAAAVVELRSAGERDGLIVREEVRLHLAWGAIPDAVRALERLVKLAPEDVNAAIDLARMRAATGDVAPAAESLRARLASLEPDPRAAGAVLLSGSHGSAAGDKGRLLAALVPMEVALDRPVEALLSRLEGIDRAEAALLRARTSSAPATPGALEAALPLARGSLRAELLVELARVEARDGPERARARVTEALEIDGRSRGALLIRSLLAGHGEAAARADRAAALSGIDEPSSDPALLAYASGREDASVALDSFRFVHQRANEEARRPGLVHSDAADWTPPSPALLDRAALSLRYALAVDPWIAPARALLGRVEWARGHGERAATLALEALHRDPLDTAAATVLALSVTKEDFALAVSETGPALAASEGVEGRSLRDALAGLHARNGDFAGAASLMIEAARVEPIDREVLARAADRARQAGGLFSEDAAALAAKLEALNAAADEARALAHEAETRAGREQQRCFALCKRALEAAPDDVEVASIVATALKKVFRAVVDMNGGIHVYDRDRDPIVRTMTQALVDGRMATDALRHAAGQHSSFGQELIRDWRAHLAGATGRERTALRLALAVVATTREAFGADKVSAFLEKSERVLPAVVRDDLHELVLVAPECPTVYCARALAYARAGRMASMRADVDRVRWRHVTTLGDEWLACAIEVAAGNLDGAEQLALAAFRAPNVVASDKLMFVQDEPFVRLKGSPSWARVVAEALK